MSSYQFAWQLYDELNGTDHKQNLHLYCQFYQLADLYLFLS